MTAMKAEGQPSFSVDKQTLQCYEIGLPAPVDFDTRNPLSEGSEILFARRADAPTDPVSFVIKKYAKQGGKSNPFYVAEKYLTQNAQVKSTTLVSAVSLFEDDTASYVVYPLPKGKRLVNSADVKDDELRKKLAIQFLSLLRSLHNQGALYLKVRHNNVFFNDRGKLIVLGFDSGALIPGGRFAKAADAMKSKGGESFVSTSLFTKWYPDLIPELDWLSLGTFVCSLWQDTLPFADGENTPNPGKVNCTNATLVLDLLNVAKSVRAGYDPRAETLFKPALNVVREDQKFAIDEFHIDWSNGILIGYGDTEIGFRQNDGVVFLTGEGAELSIGAAGLTLKDTRMPWQTRAVTLGPNGVKLDHDWAKIELSADGLTWYGGFLGKLSLGPQGFRMDFGRDYISIEEGKPIDIQFDSKKPGMKLDGGNVVLSLPHTNKVVVGKDGLLVENMHQFLNVNADGLKMHVMNLDFNILSSPPSLFMQAGPASLSICADGIDIALADNTFHADKDEVVFTAEGITLTINDRGVKLENDNPEFDLSAYAPPIPKLNFTPPQPKTPPIPKPPKPSMGLPGVPSIPSVPSIPKMPSFGGGAEKAGQVEDHLKPGETVKEQVDIVRRKMLFAKKTVHLVRTNTDRLFFCSELYGEKRGDDLVLGKSSTAEALKDKTIKLKTADGKEVALTFKNHADRDPWIAKFQEIIRSLV